MIHLLFLHFLRSVYSEKTEMGNDVLRSSNLPVFHSSNSIEKQSVHKLEWSLNSLIRDRESLLLRKKVGYGEELNVGESKLAANDFLCTTCGAANTWLSFAILSALANWFLACERLAVLTLPTLLFFSLLILLSVFCSIFSLLHYLFSSSFSNSPNTHSIPLTLFYFPLLHLFPTIAVNGQSCEDLFHFLEHSKLEFVPDTRTQFSNVGIALLARCLEGRTLSVSQSSKSLGLFQTGFPSELFLLHNKFLVGMKRVKMSALGMRNVFCFSRGSLELCQRSVDFGQFPLWIFSRCRNSQQISIQMKSRRTLVSWNYWRLSLVRFLANQTRSFSCHGNLSLQCGKSDIFGRTWFEMCNS